METIRLVKTAFRKLKAHSYFDKTTLPLRDKIVEFESAWDFKMKIQAIADEYDKAKLCQSTLMVEILSSIDVLPFPKKMVNANSDDDKTKEKAVISIGNPKEKPIIDELQYFIDMDVRGHVLGVMWIMAFGKRIDEQSIESARGNRLRKSLIWKDDGDILDSPALFEPYFAQYSLWRDGGLSVANELLTKNHDVMILTLDLKKFYYRTGISKKAFKNIVEIDDNSKDVNLHDAIYAIFEKYTEILHTKKIEHSGIVLPIGFLPSAVLSNWCLEKFDKGILDYWNPSYYGRYVDDVIIVEKIEKGSEIYKLARENKLEKDFVIDYYLGNDRRKTAQVFVSKSTFPKTDEQQTNENSEQQTPKSKEDDLYRVNPAFCLSDESVYEFQSNKTRIIALFADNNSTALINKFKREIYENVSEFRLMPEVGEAFSQDDFSEFYKLENDATINKLRGVREILMDKYELSKFLGRYRVVSSLVEDGRLKRKFTSVIGKMFNDRELIEHYILWERVFEIFITDKDYTGFIKFAKRVKHAIASLTLKEERARESAVQSSLYRHFDAAVHRTLSLVWGENAKKIIEAMFGENFNSKPHLNEMRRNYIVTYMSNKYVMSVPAEVIQCPTDIVDDMDINFTEFRDGFDYLCKEGAIECELEYLPYFRQAQDIAVSSFLGKICDYSCNVCQESTCEKCEKHPNLSFNEYIIKIKKVVSEAPVEFKEMSGIFDSKKQNGIMV